MDTPFFVILQRGCIAPVFYSDSALVKIFSQLPGLHVAFSLVLSGQLVMFASWEEDSGGIPLLSLHRFSMFACEIFPASLSRSNRILLLEGKADFSSIRKGVGTISLALGFSFLTHSLPPLSLRLWLALCLLPICSSLDVLSW